VISRLVLAGVVDSDRLAGEGVKQVRGSGTLRPQAAVVILAVLVLLSRGEGRFVSDAHDGDLENSRQLAPVAQDPLDPEPTPVPIRLESDAAPTAAPTAAVTPSLLATMTPEPTSTPEPVSTERPAPPPSDDEDMAQVVTQPDTGRKEIAVTFDAGDGRGHTEAILDLLGQYGAVGTFGVTGEWAVANPDLMRDIVDGGHQLINHSYTHQSFTGHSTGGERMSDQQMRAEVLDTEQVIRETTGGYEVAPYFRFPYGDYSGSSLAILKQLGYDYSIWWGCDSKAWMGHTVDDIVEECGREKAAPGLIVLLHVDVDPDFHALPQLLEAYSRAGYDLVSVEQLMQP
jgi:peptidoglycan-N-acetylglucosamine deacetylase